MKKNSYPNNELSLNDRFFYFIELYGNKNLTRSVTPDVLYQSITESLDLTRLIYVNFDVCTEYYFNGPYVTSLKREKFEEIGILSNFSILLS